MRNALFVALLALLGSMNQACSERDAFARGHRRGGRRGPSGVPAHMSAAVPNVNSYYTWDLFSFSGKNATATDWTEDNAIDILDTVDGSPAVGQATTGLTLSTADTDTGVTFASIDSDGFYVAQPSAMGGTSDGDDIHFQFAVYVPSVINGDYLWMFRRTTVSEGQAYVNYLTAGRIIFSFRASASTVYSCILANGFDFSATPGWHLFDILMHDDNDTTPYATNWVDGTSYTCADGSVDYGAFTANGAVYVGEGGAGGSTSGDSTILFLGARVDTGQIDTTSHTAQCQALGICP